MSKIPPVGLLRMLIARWRTFADELYTCQPPSITAASHASAVRNCATELEAALATLPQQHEALLDLQAFGEGEKTAALKAQDRPQYDFYAGWVSALDRLAIQVTFGALSPAPPQDRLRDYVQHKPDCPHSLPNVVLDLGPGWTQSVYNTQPCNCGLTELLQVPPTKESIRLDAALSFLEALQERHIYLHDGHGNELPQQEFIQAVTNALASSLPR